jgi:hypothetical protein
MKSSPHWIYYLFTLEAAIRDVEEAAKLPPKK